MSNNRWQPFQVTSYRGLGVRRSSATSIAISFKHPLEPNTRVTVDSASPQCYILWSYNTCYTYRTGSLCSELQDIAFWCINILAIDLLRFIHILVSWRAGQREESMELGHYYHHNCAFSRTGFQYIIQICQSLLQVTTLISYSDCHSILTHQLGQYYTLSFRSHWPANRTCQPYVPADITSYQQQKIHHFAHASCSFLFAVFPQTVLAGVAVARP